MYMPRTRDNPIGTIIEPWSITLKASEAQALAERNIKPSEMEMQGIYNAIRGQCLVGKRELFINWPQKGQAIAEILRQEGYKVTLLHARQPGPDEMRIVW